jgi:hypothetical protein
MKPGARFAIFADGRAISEDVAAIVDAVTGRLGSASGNAASSAEGVLIVSPRSPRAPAAMASCLRSVHGCVTAGCTSFVTVAQAAPFLKGGRSRQQFLFWTAPRAPAAPGRRADWPGLRPRRGARLVRVRAARGPIASGTTSIKSTRCRAGLGPGVFSAHVAREFCNALPLKRFLHFFQRFASERP